MKPSNKVLIFTLLLSASVIFIIPAAVNIKYSNGRDAHDTSHVYRTLHPFKTILIKGISNCLIVPSDSFRVASSKKYMSSVLDISLKDTLSLALHGINPSDSTEVILYLPIDKVDMIISYSSSIRLRGQIRPNEDPSYHLVLHNSTVSTAAFRLRQFFNRLELEGRENSSLIIPDFIHINDLRLKNVNKTSIRPRAEIATIKTTFDSKANVQMARANGKTEITGNP
jgi:hypothetical protein